MKRRLPIVYNTRYLKTYDHCQKRICHCQKSAEEREKKGEVGERKNIRKNGTKKLLCIFKKIANFIDK